MASHNVQWYHCTYQEHELLLTMNNDDVSQCLNANHSDNNGKTSTYIPSCIMTHKDSCGTADWLMWYKLVLI